MLMVIDGMGDVKVKWHVPNTPTEYEILGTAVKPLGLLESVQVQVQVRAGGPGKIAPTCPYSQAGLGSRAHNFPVSRCLPRYPIPIRP